jgi:hypothetical protein
MTVTSINPHTMILHTGNGKYLLNYDSIVALVKQDNSIELNSCWDQSRTTMKRISEFLGQPAQITRQQVEDGVIIIDDYLGSQI